MEEQIKEILMKYNKGFFYWLFNKKKIEKELEDDLTILDGLNEEEFKDIIDFMLLLLKIAKTNLISTTRGNINLIPNISKNDIKLLFFISEKVTFEHRIGWFSREFSVYSHSTGYIGRISLNPFDTEAHNNYIITFIKLFLKEYILGGYVYNYHKMYRKGVK